MSDHPRVIVVGAGIAGLTAAFRLRRDGFAVTVLERSGPELIGGRMSTVERHGFHVDVGATLLLASYHEMLRLAADAGLADQVRPASPVFGIVRDGTARHIQAVPRARLARSPLLRSLAPSDLLKVGADFLRARRVLDWDDMSGAASLDFESVREYATRRGLRPDTLEYLLAPFVAGPALAEPERASIISAFCYLNTIIAGSGSFTSPCGVGFLPRGLARHLDVRHFAEVTSVAERGGEVTVTWTGPGESEHTEQVAACVVAVPPPHVLALHDRLDPTLRELFEGMEYSRSVHVAFGLDRPTAEPSLLLQVPRVEHPDLVAYVMEHNQAPDRVPPGTGLVMAHFRGTWSTRNWGLDDSKVIDRALEATERLGVLPELTSSATMAEVLRVSPCTVIRRPGEYRAITRAARALGAGPRIQFAGGDYLAHSTTNGSVCSGERAARRVTALFRR
ncbi:protoporphyrinogen/coproporphyrinogen oxidase [Actinomadura rubrisoli]|uniref:FAD-dependent oxidoreductase n=1 Tax=Actinomadura rubrisoli TaxID=2530368 RepID=A0A4R5AWP5_9ACTN|nr:NAD(P)/FAD-dependent oxidoreductase [Actinomadura rubrisoli]TDD75072.1 FAD-dependent oxidoreductase [Actinomadura rubrisoli]